MQIRETPGDYKFDWHCAPRKQFIVNLDGAVDVEVSDGTRKVCTRPSAYDDMLCPPAPTCRCRGLHSALGRADGARGLHREGAPGPDLTPT